MHIVRWLTAFRGWLAKSVADTISTCSVRFSRSSGPQLSHPLFGSIENWAFQLPPIEKWSLYFDGEHTCWPPTLNGKHDCLPGASPPRRLKQQHSQQVGDGQALGDGQIAAGVWLN